MLPIGKDATIPGSAEAPKDVGAGFYTVPCAGIKNMAPITFVFGNKHYAIHSDDFNAGAVKEGSDQCVGSIIADDPKDNLAIVGDAFMKNWYSVFDYGNKQVGFAQATH